MTNVYTDEEYAIALASVSAQAEEKLGGPLRSTYPLEKIIDLRSYAKSRTSLESEPLTAEQAAWKVMFSSLTELLRTNAPELLAKLDEFEQKNDALESLEYALQHYKAAHPHDYGFTVAVGFMIVGGLLGFLRSPGIGSVLFSGVVSWIAGLLFSIFVMNSAAVQIRIGFKLEGTVLTRLGRWLIYHALEDYARK